MAKKKKKPKQKSIEELKRDIQDKIYKKRKQK